MPSRNSFGVSYFLLLLLEKCNTVGEKFDVFLSTFSGNTLVCEGTTECTTILVFFILKLVLFRNLVIVLIRVILLKRIYKAKMLTIEL
jgi:hypothetical protein